MLNRYISLSELHFQFLGFDFFLFFYSKGKYKSEATSYISNCDIVLVNILEIHAYEDTIMFI